MAEKTLALQDGKRRMVCVQALLGGVPQAPRLVEEKKARKSITLRPTVLDPLCPTPGTPARTGTRAPGPGPVWLWNQGGQRKGH